MLGPGDHRPGKNWRPFALWPRVSFGGRNLYPTDMAQTDGTSTVFGKFAEATRRHPNRPFLNVLKETAAIYGVDAGELTYTDILQSIKERKAAFHGAGYGRGHRVGLLLENRPEFFITWFALNALGASVVPINPDLKRADLAYLIGHSELCLCIVIPSRVEDIGKAIEVAGSGASVTTPGGPFPAVPSPAASGAPDANTEAALLYTSGTTGLPKGCVLTNTYFLNCADWYARLGGYCRLENSGERMLTPLPLFHMNAMACSTMAMIECGGCLTVLDRFHPQTWWDSVRECRATIVHYLGVMPPMLMQAEPSDRDKAHDVRFGFGAGVDAGLHAPFEERFGFPLIEAWAMTETGLGAVVAASEEPRHVGTRCFGKPEPDVEIKLVDDTGELVPANTPGELLVRRAGDDPRYGFFDRYLKDDAATAEVWRDGWFHTGDVVLQNEDGTLVFVDRKKNVIRRSGENISAVEVENTLATRADIQAVAVAAVPDPVRGDEVFACIVPAEGSSIIDNSEHAAEVVRWCLTQLAYYKAPGYVSYIDEVPVTATNKIQRSGVKDLVLQLFADGSYVDTRHLKKRSAA